MVKVEVSPIWPHPISCPRCHQVWRDKDEFNAEAKRIIAEYMVEKWDTDADNDVTPEDRAWQSQMDDIVGERMEGLKKQNWSPYEREEDKPIRIIVPDWGGGRTDKGSIDTTSGDSGTVRVDRGGGSGSGGGQGQAILPAHADKAEPGGDSQP
jgi:Zn-finger nucleic acid-binding protein